MVSQRRQRRSFLTLTVLLAVLIFGCLNVEIAAAGLVDDNFNTEAIGSKPAGYEYEEIGGRIEIAAVPSEADKSLALNDPGDKVIKVAKKFTPQTGKVTAELYFMQPVVSSTAKAIRLLDQNSAVAVQIETRAGAKLGYKNVDNTFTQITGFKASTWIHIAVAADIAAQKADVYINNELLLKQAPFLSPVKDIAIFESYTPGSSARGHHIDDLRIYEGAPKLDVSPKVTEAPKGPPTGNDYIKDIKIFDADRADLWALRANVQAGDQAYGDRNYLIDVIPDAYAGWDWLQTACDSKFFVGPVLVSFKLTTAADVYIAHDNRIVTKPEWMKEWKDTGDDLADTEPIPTIFSIFKRSFPAGAVVELGPNGGSAGATQYIVIIKGEGRTKGKPIAGKDPTKTAIPVTWKEALGMRPEWYAGADAIRIADNVLLYQRNNGGWYKNIDMAFPLSGNEKAILLQEKPNLDANIDNDATTFQLRYLAKVFQATQQPRFKDSIVRGLDYLFEAQYPNGGWPQYYPDNSMYRAHITYNDNAMFNVLTLLRDIHDRKPDFTFLEAGWRARAAQAIYKGVDCLLKTQIRVNGRVTAWCAQHDEKTLAPAAARSYELPSISGKESVGITRFLMSIEDPSPAVIESVQAAIAWFNETRITGLKVYRKPDPALPNGYDIVAEPDPNAPPIWARFYDIETNRPFFCGRDGVKKASLAEIEYERRTGYDYYTIAPGLLLEEYSAWQAKWVAPKGK